MTVRQQQHLLAYLGYYVGEIDGVVGTLTRVAVMSFQQDYGLTADGIVGPATEKALKHAVTYGMPAKEVKDDLWAGIKYWSREEFRCQCGGKYCDGFPAEPSRKLLELADNVRKHFGKRGHRISGLRCKVWNSHEGGVSNSRHMTGKALDFRIEGKSSAEVLAYVNTLPGVRYAYAINSTNVHMDVE